MISVVICTRNRKDLLLKNVSHLWRLDIKEVVVIDDASTDGTRDVLRDLARTCESNGIILKFETNRVREGSARNWNKGAQAASGEVVILLNDDTFFQNDISLSSLQTKFQQMPSLGIIGATVIEERRRTLDPSFYLQQWLARGFVAVTGFPLLSQRKESGWSSFVSGVMAVRKDVFKDASFDEIYEGTCYREESDFQLRASRSGWNILHDTTFRVVHYGESIGGHHEDSACTRMYWKGANHFIFLRKHFRGIRRLVYMIAAVIILIMYRPSCTRETISGIKTGLAKPFVRNQ